MEGNINFLFWEKLKKKNGMEGNGNTHKNVPNRPYGFKIYLVNVKTMRTIAQIFVAFSER